MAKPQRWQWPALAPAPQMSRAQEERFWDDPMAEVGEVVEVVEAAAAAACRRRPQAQRAVPASEAMPGAGLAWACAQVGAGAPALAQRALQWASASLAVPACSHQCGHASALTRGAGAARACGLPSRSWPIA